MTGANLKVIFLQISIFVLEVPSQLISGQAAYCSYYFSFDAPIIACIAWKPKSNPTTQQNYLLTD